MAAPGVASAAAALLNEHRLRMLLRADGEGFTRVEALPRRASQAHRMLIGRSAQQALALLPTLYPLSAFAHRSAASAALSSAQGDFAQDSAVQQALLLERLREQLLPLHREWPLCMGMAPLQAMLQDIDQATRGLDGRRTGEPAALRELVERRTLGMPAQQFWQMDSAAQLRRWARDHAHLAPARFLTWLAVQPLALGRPRLPPPLPALQPGQLAPLLLGPDGGEFEAGPQWQASCRETGAWPEHAQHPLLRDLAQPGAEPAAALLARFVARLLDLAHGLLAWCGQSEAPPALRAAEGTALVDTARGLLAYGVALDRGGRIERCVIVSPAQWNFHPQGTAVGMLRSIAWTTPRQVAQSASLVACAVDPYVRCDFVLPAAPRP